MLLLSLVVALLAVLQLGDFFQAGGEIGLVILAVSGFAVLSLSLFALVYAVARRAGALTAAALFLVLIALIPMAMPGLVQAIAGRSALPLALELTVPALIAVLVQWGLVRRRWLLAAGEDDLSRWPWITTVAAGLVVLSPFGLTFLADTLKHSPTDSTWEFTATVTAAVLGALLVMAWIECYIRERILNRRMAAGGAPAPPMAGGGAKTAV
jgi:hypothetical protein